MYRALYRKWRPQRFEDVVAQRGIVTALRNQIATGRVGHAYLFTGVRGTGKTTCAKIFAKAVNCLHPHNGDPCGECEICRGIDNGSILDVVEMDAASNNGVDDIRDLRDETAYTPSACQYKVYIIDEVHMLSTAAFNALLKTLEEPPAHVIFILATTEIQKVPATILSRCQRYDFTRIGPEDIAKRVEYIAGQEGLELTGDGAELIARLADGAMRDALSILDTCAGVTAKVDADVVRRMAGVTDRSYLFRISDAIEAQDAAAALTQLAQLRQQSVDVKRLTEELIAHYRALMLAALPGGQTLLSGVSPEEEAQYLEKGPRLGQREAIRAIRTLGNALEHMTRGSDQRIELELALFSLSEPAQQPVYAAAACRPAPRSGPPAGGPPSLCDGSGAAADHSDLAAGTGSTRGRGASKAGSRAAGKRPSPCGGRRPAPAAGRAAGRRRSLAAVGRIGPAHPAGAGAKTGSAAGTPAAADGTRPGEPRRPQAQHAPQGGSGGHQPLPTVGRGGQAAARKRPHALHLSEEIEGLFRRHPRADRRRKDLPGFHPRQQGQPAAHQKADRAGVRRGGAHWPIRAEECPPPLGQRRGVAAQIGAAGAGRQH